MYISRKLNIWGENLKKIIIQSPTLQFCDIIIGYFMLV